MNGLAFGLLTVGVVIVLVAAITCCWGLLDGRDARRDARRRNQAHRP